MTHICVSKITIIGSVNGFSPDWQQAIIWTNAGILLIRPLGIRIQWNFNRYYNIFIQANAFESVCKMATILSRPQYVNSLWPTDVIRDIDLGQHWLRKWIVAN